jgi:hypothetical protein
MDFPTQTFTAIGAISAAIIAGGISFISTVLAKDQKTSEFRQAWIDGLRNDMAEYVSLFSVTISLIQIKIGQGNSAKEIIDFMVLNNDSFYKLEMMEARISLRINPVEHKKFVGRLLALEEYAKKIETLRDTELKSTLLKEFINDSQAVLKAEWKRVKRGEPVFIATKWISLFVFIVATYFGIQYALGHFQIVLV